MEKKQLAEEAVNQIENIFGEHPTYRRAHARGEIYEAVFSANGKAEPFTEAPHLQQGEVKAIVRFSHFSPDPTWADAMSPVKGMAVQFEVPGGEVTNIVGVTSPVFFAKTPEVFTEMLGITKSFKKGKPHLLELTELMMKYPESRAFVEVMKKMEAPSSFATGRYHSIHAFYFTKKTSRQQPVKYVWEPVSGMDTLSLKDVAAMPIGHYEADLEDRVNERQVDFDLNIILGAEEDPTDDPTKDWPAEREEISIGRLTLVRKRQDMDSVVFDPTIMTDGIVCSEDPILNFRHDAYPISYNRRMSER